LAVPVTLIGWLPHEVIPAPLNWTEAPIFGGATVKGSGKVRVAVNVTGWPTVGVAGTELTLTVMFAWETVAATAVLAGLVV
jgi:hypothetical protein